MTTRIFAIEGMTCDHCVQAVTDEVAKIPGVTDIAVDLAGNTVTVAAETLDEAAVRAAVDEAGYTVVG